MSKRTRGKSPTSENTLVNNLLASGTGVQFVDGVGDLDALYDDSEDELENKCNSDSNDHVDDTDEDPDFEPTQCDETVSSEEEAPSMFTGRPRGRPPNGNNSSQSSVNLGDISSERLTSRRRRPRLENQPDYNVYNVQCPIGEADANEGWRIFSEENYQGFETNHEFFEIPGPKHHPPNNAKPLS
ncbi:hypothetical protein J6590_107188 [Homalodisca vitripennis]|nr:hypothetical protein J6590_107188 [Homalodisca vitripennis]